MSALAGSGQSGTVRAAVIPAPGAALEIRRYPVPELEPGAVLLRTVAAEVCGTDVHLWHGRLSGVPYPLIPGHVSVGTVVATGGDVATLDGEVLRPGRMVTFLDVHGTCHSCWHCLVAKSSTRCPNRKVYGITYGADDGLLGGWSEAIYLKPGVHVVPLRGSMTPELWIAAGCGMPTALHAVDTAAIRLADRVVVLGAGPVGLCATALALASGAAWVGMVEPASIRAEAATRMGADAVAPPWEAEAMVRGATGGRGAEVVIEASGAPQAVGQALDLARDCGRVIVVGQYTDHGSVAWNPHAQLNRKHLEVRGVWGSDLSHIWRGMDLLDRFGGDYPWTGIISRRYGLDDAQQALQDVEARRVVKAVIEPGARSKEGR